MFQLPATVNKKCVCVWYTILLGVLMHRKYLRNRGFFLIRFVTISLNPNIGNVNVENGQNNTL